VRFAHHGGKRCAERTLEIFLSKLLIFVTFVVRAVFSLVAALPRCVFAVYGLRARSAPLATAEPGLDKP
jgi:hypothetical protein